MINQDLPRKVLITGGREVGGLTSFAESLKEGFSKLGIYAEVIAPLQTFSRWQELRDRYVLKILSTTAVFAAPFARRAICVSHGIPCVAHQGWKVTGAVLASYRLANACRSSRLVAVSDYTTLHLRNIFNLRVDATIRNPVRSIFLTPLPGNLERNYVTYVGRLHRSKNVHRLMPSIVEVLNENPGMRAAIVGDGELRSSLMSSVRGDKRIEFPGTLNPSQVLEQLRRTRLFTSANATEPFGITYLEALSQGCAVAMPACGGGMEIAMDQIGSQVQLFPITMEARSVTAAFRRALQFRHEGLCLSSYAAEEVARKYLEVDATFACGLMSPHALIPEILK